MAEQKKPQGSAGRPAAGRAVPPPQNPEYPAANSSGNGAGNGAMQKYWQLNILLILILLSIWAIVSYFAGIIFVEPMNYFRIGNLPVGFWFAQQGSIYVFVALIFVYSLIMDRIDKKFDVQE